MCGEVSEIRSCISAAQGLCVKTNSTAVQMFNVFITIKYFFENCDMY